MSATPPLSVVLLSGRRTGSLLFPLLCAAWTIYNEAARTATLIVAVVLDATTVFILAAIVNEEVETAAASRRVIGDAGSRRVNFISCIPFLWAVYSRV